MDEMPLKPQILDWTIMCWYLHMIDPSYDLTHFLCDCVHRWSSHHTDSTDSYEVLFVDTHTTIGIVLVSYPSPWYPLIPHEYTRSFLLVVVLVTDHLKNSHSESCRVFVRDNYSSFFVEEIPEPPSYGLTIIWTRDCLIIKPHLTVDR